MATIFNAVTANFDITWDPTTRIFYLAQSAHRHAEEAQHSLKAYAKLTKGGLTGESFNDVLKAIRAAKEAADQACQNWQTIYDIFNDVD